MFILRKKRFNFIAVMAVILVAYSVFSALSWSDIKNKENSIKSQNLTSSKIFDDEISLSKIQELLKSQKKSCEVSPLISWQKEIISPLKKSIESCSTELSKFEKYQNSLKNISKYIENDQRIAQETENFANKIKEVDSKDFEKMFEIWREFGENTAKLEGFLAENLKLVITKVEKSLENMISADKNQDFDKYSAARKEFDAAIQGFFALKNDENAREKMILEFLEVR